MPSLPIVPGNINAVAGNYFSYSSKSDEGDGGPATAAAIGRVYRLALDGKRNTLYLADADNGVIRAVSVPPSNPSAPNAVINGVINSVPLTASLTRLDNPHGLAVDQNTGDLYVAETGRQVIRRIPFPFLGHTVDIVVGTDTVEGFSGDGGPAVLATLSSPSAVAVSPAGEIFVADWFNCRIRHVTPYPAGRTITTIAGGGVLTGTTADGGPATLAYLPGPYGLALNSASGTLYFSDLTANVMRAVSLGDKRIYTLVGTPSQAGYAGDNGPATSALLFEPRGFDVDAGGNLFLADAKNNLVRYYDQVREGATCATTFGTLHPYMTQSTPPHPTSSHPTLLHPTPSHPTTPPQSRPTPPHPRPVATSFHSPAAAPARAPRITAQPHPPDSCCRPTSCWISPTNASSSPTPTTSPCAA